MQKDLLEELINYSLDNPKEKIIREIEVAGADGRYFITDTGKVVSFCGNQAMELKGNDNGKGYLQVKIGGAQYYIHSLVYNTFTKEEDKIELQIHHLDSDKSNNNLSNLVKVTPQKHALIHKLLNKWNSMEKL